MAGGEAAQNHFCGAGERFFQACQAAKGRNRFVNRLLQLCHAGKLRKMFGLGNYEIAKTKLACTKRRPYINNQATMNAPRYITIFVCMLLAFMLLQGLMWPLRPKADWQPGWWQSPILAGAGHILSLPAMIPGLVLENLGVFNPGVLLSVTAFGLLVEMAFVSVVVHFITRRWFELYNDR